jgi:hypothetical protein
VPWRRPAPSASSASPWVGPESGGDVAITLEAE